MALAFVTGNSASATASPATTGALTGTIVAGQLIVLTITNDSGTLTSVSAVTDSKGNTYTKIQTPVSNSVVVEMWYTVVTTGGTGLTVSATWNTGNTGRCVVIAQYFNGFVSTPTLDKFSTASATSLSAGGGTTATTTVAAELVVLGGGHAAAVSAFSLGTGYTNLTTVNVINAAAAQSSKVVAATGAQTGGTTIAASRANVGMIATFYDGSTTQTLTSPFIAAASLTFSMILAMVLLNTTIGPTSVLFAPDVALGPITLAPPFLTSGATIFNPVVSPGPVTLAAPAIAAGSTTFNMQLNLVLALGFIASSAVVSPPAITLGTYTMAAPVIASSTIYYTPNVTLGGVTLTNPNIPSTTVMFPPIVARRLNPNELLLLGVG